MILDFPRAVEFNEMLVDLTVLDQKKVLTTATLINSLINDKTPDIELDSRLPDESHLSVMSDLREMARILEEAVTVFLRKISGKAIIIGAGINEDSELLCLWISDTEDTV